MFNIGLLLRYGREIIIGVLLAVLAGTVFKYSSQIKYLKLESDKIAIQHKLQLTEIQAESYKIQQTRHQEVINAINANSEQQKIIIADYRNAISDVNGLSDTIDNINYTVTEANTAARTDFTNALAVISKECAKEYLEMAKIADKHASDARMMREAWGKNN